MGLLYDFLGHSLAVESSVSIDFVVVENNQTTKWPNI